MTARIVLNVPRLVSLRRAAMQLGIPGQLLREELERNGATLRRFGKRLQVDERDLQRLFNAAAEPTHEQAAARSDMLRVEACRRVMGEHAAEQYAARLARRRRQRQAAMPPPEVEPHGRPAGRVTARQADGVRP